VAPNKGYAVSAGSDGLALIWDARQHQPISWWQAGEKAILACAFSPDGTRLLTGSLDGLLAQWDLATRRQLSNFLAHPRPIACIAFSPDGTRFATCSWDGSAILWKAQGDGKGAVLHGHKDIVAGCRFTADGKRLFTWSYDRSLRLWDTQWGTTVATWTGHSDRVLAGDASPDGRWLASAGRDGHVVLWDAVRGQEIARHSDITGEVRACLFTPDAELLFVITQEGEITALPIPDFQGPLCEETGLVIECAAFSRTGEHLVIGTSTGELKFIGPPGMSDRALCVTPSEMQVNRPGFFARMFKLERLERVLRCVCPNCAHAFELSSPSPADTDCARCRRPLKINDFAFSEQPPGPAPANAPSTVIRRTTFYPTPPAD
jgi:WD40 repeat protein